MLILSVASFEIHLENEYSNFAIKALAKTTLLEIKF